MPVLDAAVESFPVMCGFAFPAKHGKAAYDNLRSDGAYDGANEDMVIV
jgi:hypothetical protein